MAHPSTAPAPQVLRTTAWSDYALLDSGAGRKLERYGSYTVVRPEPQCLWRPRLDQTIWNAADALFDPSDDEDAGNWRFARTVPDTWPLTWEDVKFQGRFTAFRHLAFFPEQAANWSWLKAKVAAADRPLNILNLFGYTGVASLVVAKAGASVTHVDASKRAVGWARENAKLSSLAEAPIRWICEDARKYVAREVRRGMHYDGIILDPPKYGRGPGGEVWKLLEDLPALLADCVALLSPEASFLLLNAYADRVSGLSLAGTMRDALEGRSGQIDWGELALMEGGGERGVGVSFFARWSNAA